MGASNSKAGTIGSIEASGERAARKAAASHTFELLTRLGYGVRGLIYITMGLLAIQVVLGKGGGLTTPQGAISTIGKQPAGLLLLWIVLIGLISYSLWGVVRAVFDPLNKGKDAKGLMARFGFLMSAFGYAVMILPTYGYIMGASHATSASQTEKIITAVIAMPGGRWAIGLIGLAVMVAGVYQVYLGISSKFERQFQIYALTPKEVQLTTNIARFGTAARGVVLAIVGSLVMLAAYRVNPSQPVGMDTALATLMHQPYGIWLVGIVALGLIAFGFYSVLGAVWFRLKR